MSGGATGGKLTLGPLLFHWPAAQWRDFYFRIADEAPVDCVHLGEVVCPKRVPSLAASLPEVVERLAAAGKQVVLSSLALISSEAETASARDLAAGSDLLIEANDVAAVSLAAGRPFVVGPFVNVYNEATLARLAGLGAVRVCLPAELPAPTIAHLAAPGGPEIEVQAFGRLPLALSARCYHARAAGLHKDGCRFVCAEDPDGMVVETVDGTPFLAVNGVQTLSYRHHAPLSGLTALAAAGVARFRLWPHSCDMVAVAALYRALLEGAVDGTEAAADLAALLPQAEFADGYLHGREGHAWLG